MTATAPTTYLLTADDLAGFPDDGKRREIVEGVLFAAAALSRFHQEVLARLIVLIRTYTGARKLGKAYFAPVDVRFSDHTIVQPDLLYIRRERLGIYRGNTVFGAPDLVIEVVSPSNRGYDLTEKTRLYEANAVPAYWTFDPETRRIDQRVLQGASYSAASAQHGLSTSTVIPGLTIDPVEIFAPEDD